MNKTRPHVLITAGNTREKIDCVRWWSNIFTGQIQSCVTRVNRTSSRQQIVPHFYSNRALSRPAIWKGTAERRTSIGWIQCCVNGRRTRIRREWAWCVC